MNHGPECIDMTWNILRTRRLKVVQMKSLGLYMAPPQGLKFLHSDIYGNTSKIFFSRNAAPDGIIFSMEHP